jgi:Acyl-CoA synthetases (AMP-forming)/AMP-acid ligases II
MSKILKTAGALPFLFAVFLNSFVDLGHKIVIQNTIFKVYDGSTQIVYAAIINAMILLPYILFFSPAGFASDRFPKTSVMRFSAWLAVGLTSAITVCYMLGWFWPAFAMTFLLAAQSAFYYPAKYGYLKAFFGKQNLAPANGAVQAVSIVAILAGTFIFSIFFWKPHSSRHTLSPHSNVGILSSLVPVGIILIVTSLAEVFMIYRLPSIRPGDPRMNFDTKAFVCGKLFKQDLDPVWRRDVIRLSVIGLAMFWSIGQVLLASFPEFAKSQLGETNTIVIQGTVGASGIGIVIGSLIASRLSRNYIELGLIPIAAVGIAVGLWILPNLTSMKFFIADFIFIGAMGGMFIVPLQSLVQFYAGENELGRVLAGSNLIQNIAMLCVLLITIGFAVVGLSSKQLLLVTAGLSVVGGIYTVMKLPQSLVQFVMGGTFALRYRTDVQGMKNIPERGGVLLLGNHISWIDWAIVQIASPRPVRFVMLKSIYQRWYLKWFFDLFGCIPISSGADSKKSLERVAELLDAGEVVCLFPEGAISRNGQLGQFRNGFERAIAMTATDIKILPFYLRGLWGSQFSRASNDLKRKQPRGSKRDLIVAFGEPIEKDATTDQVKRRVFDLSIKSWDSFVQQLPSLPNAWIESVKNNKSQAIAIADTTTQPLSPSRALAVSITLGRHLKLGDSAYKNDINIGILLPTSAAAVLTNMALLLKGKTLVNLNYSASNLAMQGAIDQAEIKSIYTSKKFIGKLQSRGIDFTSQLEQLRVIYLEDVFAGLSKVELVSQWLLVKLLPARLLRLLFSKPTLNTDHAVILFSSGSEGVPKGVQLSHQNIMANLKQVADVLNTQPDDVIMASLPLFHAFGLTVTQFLPLIEGIPMVCHPDPTDSFGIAKAIAQYRATTLFGTSTFLRLYSSNRKVHPLMLSSLRIVVAGAERLQPEVRSAFETKFNKTVYEGYGATETTPVASVNVPDALDTDSWRPQVGTKLGSVGMPLPGTSFRIVDPESFDELATDEEGMILIGGAQVMQGYLNNPEKTAEVIRIIDDVRWYVTGDKGRLDGDGFLTIVDRYSRFAKVGGEMISLSAVEAAVTKVLNQWFEAELKNSTEAESTTTSVHCEVIAVAISDEKKGEKIILLCNRELEIAALKAALADDNVSNLMLPSACFYLEKLPKLGSGKTDFGQAKIITENFLA